ncbi:putative porin [Rhodocyclus gracilis]
MEFFRSPLQLGVAGLFVASMSLAPAASHAADERESLETLRQTTLNLIDALVEQGIFSREKAAAMIKNAEAKAQAATASAAKDKTRSGAPVRVQYVPETVKNEIREQLKQEVLAQARSERWAEPNAIPAWLDSIKWEGDIRLRYQADSFDRDNTPAASYAALANTYGATRAAGFTGMSTANASPVANNNTTENRERYRLRARLGMLAKISDEWSAGLRLSTGNTTDRVSTNQTLGQDWNKYALVVDRAYVRYDPAEWLSLSGGRIPNPFFSTELVWSENLNFEGGAASLKGSFANNSFKPFLTVGYFPIKEDNPPATHGRAMSGAQAGAQWDLSSNTRLKFGAAMYSFNNFEGQKESNTSYQNSASYGQYEYGASLRQKGNTLFRTNAPLDGATSTLWGLASRFRPVNLTASLDLAHFDPVHVVLTGDYVKNTAFDRGEIANRTQTSISDGKDYGYLYKITVGMPKLEKARDWQVAFSYRYLGSDAVIDAFTDSDFGLGGTNLKGYMLSAHYGIDRNANIGLRWYSAESIDSFSLVAGQRFAVDVLQADLNVQF